MKRAYKWAVRAFAWIVVKLLPWRLVRAVQHAMDDELFRVARRRR